MVLSLDEACDSESLARDEAEPAEPPAETGAEAAKRPLFADAETTEDVSEGGRLSDSDVIDEETQSGDTSRF